MCDTGLFELDACVLNVVPLSSASLSGAVGLVGGVLNIIHCSSSALEFDTGILMVLRRHIQPELDGEARWMTPYTGEKGALPDPLVFFSFSFSYERRHEKHTIRNICTLKQR